MTAAATTGPVVWIVDADHWPRAYLRAELIERGYDAVGFVSLSDALARLHVSGGAPRPRLAVVDLAGQAAELKLLPALARAGVPLVGIGAAAATAADAVQQVPWAAYLRRPLTIGDIADAVDGLVEGRG